MGDAARGLEIVRRVLYPRQLRRLRDCGVADVMAAEKLWDYLTDALLRTVRDCTDEDAFVPFLICNGRVALSKALRWVRSRPGLTPCEHEPADRRTVDSAAAAELGDAVRYLRRWARPGEFELVLDRPTDSAARLGVSVPYAARRRDEAAARLRRYALKGGLE